MIKKRWLIALFLLWVLAASQLAQGRELEKERVVEVFARVGEGEQKGVAEYYGVYGGEYLEEEGQEQLLQGIAGELGVAGASCKVDRSGEESRRELKLTKKGNEASLSLRFLTSRAEGETRQYIMAKLALPGGMEEMYGCKGRLEKLFEPYCEGSRSSANIIGSYDGELSLTERNEIADGLLHEMDAKVVSENRDMQLYTIYGYTPWIEDYEMQEEEPFNVNIAMYYSRTEDKTYVYAAVPAVGLDY